MAKLHQSEFIASIKSRWPELTPLINQEQDLLHFQVKHVRNLIQHQIDSHFESDLRNTFRFIEKSFLSANSEVKNAIDVSIIEELEFRDRGKLNRSWAWEVMPSILQDLYVEFHQSPPNE